MDIGNNYNDMVSFDRADYATFKNKNNYIKYYRTLGYISDLRDCQKLSEDDYNKLVNYYEQKKPQYQA